MLATIDNHLGSYHSFRQSKPHAQAESLDCRNDADDSWWYAFGMAPMHDWYLKEWLLTLGKRQADIVRELDWNKARVSLMIRGDQQYTRDAINELSAYLNLKPYEILMHPDDAMTLRRMQDSAVQIAHLVSESPDETQSAKKVSFS